MACSTLNSGIKVCLCSTSIGGIRRIYLANWEDVDIEGVDASIDATDGRITAIPLRTGTGHYKFFKFSVRKNSSSMTSTLNVDENTGASITTELVMDWREMEYEKRKALSALLMGELAGIVEDANGHYWFLGLNLPMTATAGTGETGQSNTDSNHYSITLSDSSSDWPHEIKEGTGTGEVDLNEETSTLFEASSLVDGCTQQNQG